MPATLADIQRKYGNTIDILYKDLNVEPFMENKEFQNAYDGILLYRQVSGKLMCPICKGEYFSLGQHIYAKHGMNSSEFRDKMGLPVNLPLCNKMVSRKISDSKWGQRKNNTKYLPTAKGENSMFIKKYRLAHKKAIKKFRDSAFFKNKHGYCAAQIKHRLDTVKSLVHKTTLSEVTNIDLIKYDNNLYNFLKRNYGTIEKGILKFGLTYVGKFKYDRVKLITALRNYVVKHHKIPTTKDPGELPDKNTFTKHFGSWRRAIMTAGLDQLLKEVI